MAEAQNQTPLPPGCLFYPSDEQLLSYYLTKKNNSDVNGEGSNLYDHNVIKELDLTNFKPYELPDSVCYVYGAGGRKRHWYFYSVRVPEQGKRRMVLGGYWKKGGTQTVMSRVGRVTLGTRTRFVFYLGNSPRNAIRTDWIMHQYALGTYAEGAAFVLCRVFVKSHGESSATDNVLSSCAEEGVSAVPHIDIQRDGFLAPDNVEADISRYSLTVVIELDEQVTTEHNFQLPLGLPLVIGGDMLVEDVAELQLAAIVEQDFIELDDLLVRLT